MKAAAERRKVREASVQSVPHLSQNKDSQTLEGLTIATSDDQSITRGTPSSSKITDGSTIGLASKTQPDSANNTDSRGSVIAGTKRKGREELSASNDGNFLGPHDSTSDDHASSRDQTVSADALPARKRQRRTDQSQRPSSPMSQPPHRDNPVGRTAEALPASHPASSNIISPFSAASYEEILLSNGILKCVIVNGQQTYQLQFTTDKPQGAAYCPQHVSNPEAPAKQHRQTRRSQKLQHSLGKINEGMHQSHEISPPEYRLTSRS